MLLHRPKVSGMLSFGPRGADLPLELGDLWTSGELGGNRW